MMRRVLRALAVVSSFVLIGSFFAKMSAPNDDSSEPIHPANPPERETPTRQTAERGTFMVQLPTNAENPKDRRQRKTPRREMAAVVIAGLLLAVNIGLLWSNRSTLELQRQEIAGTYGASVVLDGPWLPTIGDDLDYLKTAGLGITAKNSGKVRAKWVSAESTMLRKALPSFLPIGIAETVRGTKTEIRPPDQTSGQRFGDALVLRFNADVFTSEDLRLIHAMKETIEISGWTKYDDGFSNQGGDVFCFDYIAGVPIHAFKDAGVSGNPNDKGNWMPCREAEQTVKEVERRQKEDGNAVH